MTTTEPLVAGRYRVIRSLGAGGMGRVWLARDETLRRDVAIKEIVLPFGLPAAEREELRLRTMREARAAARLSHPNVVQIYDVEPGEEQPWIVMEHVQSRSLLEVIEESGPLPVEQVAGIGLAVLSALDAANRVGVLHRDVKPSNVLIAHDGRVVLTDFGSAMIDEGDGAITQTGVILGSPLYTAPERVERGVSTPEADLWSLGATLYFAVEGRPPYSRATTLGSLVAITTDKPDRVRLAGPLKPVLLGLLHRNPLMRMRPAEVEERLRPLADVQTTVRLRHVPEQRAPELARPAPAAADATATAPVPAAIDVRPVETSPVRGGAVKAEIAHHRRRQGRTLAALAVVAVVLAGAGVAFVRDRVSRSPANGTPAAASAAPPPAVVAGVGEPTPTAPASAPAPTSTSRARFVLPAGFLWWTDRTGYRIAWPGNWSHLRETPTVMFFCAPGGPPTLRVRVWDDAGPDLAAALRGEESSAKLPGYRRIRAAAPADPSGRAAEWEYVFTDPKAGELHGLERVFVAGTHTYLLQWRTPTDRWDSSRKDLAVVMNSFRPAGRA